MDRDSDCEETKMNQRDRKILNNPEEDGLNPFKFNRTKKENEEIENEEEEEEGGSNSQKVAAEVNSRYTPINALVCNQKDWIVRARISKMYDKKHWDNSRGRGYLLNFELIDSYGSSI